LADAEVLLSEQFTAGSAAAAQMPKTLSIIAGFLFLASAMAAVVGFALLFPGKLLQYLAELNKSGMAAFEQIEKLAGILLIALGIGCGLTAIGLLRRKRWAWVAATALFIVNGGGDVVSYVRTHDILHSGSGVVICAIFLFGLWHPSVRAYFRAQP
jgi:hypothetical protein